METIPENRRPLIDIVLLFYPTEKGLREALFAFLEPGREDEMGYEQIRQQFFDRLIGIVKCWMLTDNTKMLRMTVHAILALRSKRDEMRKELTEEQLSFVEQVRVIQWVIMEEEHPWKQCTDGSRLERIRSYVFGRLGLWCARIAYFGRYAFRIKWEKNKSVY